MQNIRTDLAVEAHELSRREAKNATEIDGVIDVPVGIHVSPAHRITGREDVFSFFAHDFSSKPAFSLHRGTR